MKHLLAVVLIAFSLNGFAQQKPLEWHEAWRNAGAMRAVSLAQINDYQSTLRGD